MPPELKSLVESRDRSLLAISKDLLNTRNGLRSGSGIVEEFYRRVDGYVRSSTRKIEYVLRILEATNDQQFESFLDVGGWKLVNEWLEIMQSKKMVDSSKWEAVRVQSLILDMIRRSPVVEERRKDLKIGILRRLSRSPDETLANQILARWDNQNHEDSDESSSSSVDSRQSRQSNQSNHSNHSNQSHQSNHSNQAERNQDEEIDYREAYNFLERLHRHINTVSFYKSL